MTTYGEALAAARATLAEAGIASAALDARLLLAAATRLDMAALLSRGRECVPAVARTAFDAHIRRRLKGEPVARILGEKEFWGLPFKLGPATLVPRPETETLVEAVLTEARRRFPPDVRIVDLGTGSGAILIALLKELPDATGVATDSSPEALEVARLNAERLGVASRIGFECVSFAQGPRGSFHVVVANPPYIRSDSIDALEREVRDYDPRLALDGGPNGLAAYRTILGRIGRLLVEGGLIALEVGSDQCEAVSVLCREAGLDQLAVHRDLAGWGRVVTAVRSAPTIGSER